MVEIAEKFMIKVKSEVNNENNFARVHYYINRFRDHFGDPPILADPRKLTVTREITIGNKTQIVTRNLNKGVRYYILLNDNIGQVIFLLFSDIFESRVDVIFPESFSVDPNIQDWFTSKKQEMMERGINRNFYINKNIKKEIMQIERKFKNGGQSEGFRTREIHRITESRN